MALKDMLEVIEEDGKQRCADIVSQAEKNAEMIVREARVEGEEIRQQEIEKIRSVILVDRIKTLNEARMAVKREMAQAKEEVIQETFRQAYSEIQEFRATPKYNQAFEKLMAEVLSEVEGKILVSVEKKDEDLARQYLNRSGIQYEFADGMNSSGGLRVSTMDGRISLTNTFGVRMEKAKKLLKSDVMNILFG